MKHFILITGMICFLSFAAPGCGDAPDNDAKAPGTMTENTVKRLESGIEKAEEKAVQAKEDVQQAAGEIKDAVGKKVAFATQKTADAIDTAEETVSTAAKKGAGTATAAIEKTREAASEAVDEIKNQVSETTDAATAMVADQINALAGVIEMNHAQAFDSHRMGIVIFNHQTHYTAAPDGYGLACGECHHDASGNPLELQEGDAVQGCMACHDKAGKPKKPSEMSKEAWDEMQLEYYYGAIHANCINCHKAGGAGPVKCADCHPRPEI